MAKASAIQILNKNKKKADDEVDTEVEDIEVDTEVEDIEVDTEVEDTEDDENETEAADDSDDDSEDKVVKKPAAKKAAAKKEPTKATATKTKPAANDEIVEVASEIENMTEAKALKALGEMLEAQSFDEFKIGGLLSRIQTEGWIGEHENFRSYVEAEHGIKYRTAMYWISIYNDLVASGVQWTKVKRLGWSKIKELSPILTTDNVAEVVKDVKDMTVMQVQAYVAEFNKSGDTKKAKQETEGDQLKSKTFKLFEGQKESVEIAIEKAKTQANTDSDGAALEYICVEFSSGSKKAKPSSKKKSDEDVSVEMPTSADELVPFLQAIRAEFDADETEAALSEVLEAVAQVFPDASIEVSLD